MITSLSSETLREMLLGGDAFQIQQLFADAHPADVAEMLARLCPEEQWLALSRLEPHLAAEVFSHFGPDVQSHMIVGLKRSELAWLMTYIPSDDRADIFRRLPENRQEALLPALAQAEREDIRRLASYPEGSAGSVMTSEYISLPANVTAGEALAGLRLQAPDKETIYYAYVVDERRRLRGYLSLKDLILAHPDASIESIMHRDAVFVRVAADQEEAARLISKYDLIALPVVNDDDTLVGIVTHDDAIDIIHQEHTEDLEKFMAITGSHEAGAYLRTPVGVHFKNRVGWVVGLAMMGLASGAVVHSFEETLAQLMLLAFYMPMLADTGGNTGSQSATVIVRAIALKEVKPSDALRVLTKEFRVAFLLACVLTFLTFANVMFLSRGQEIPEGLSLPRIAFAISLAIGIQVVSSTLIGAMLPLLATRFKLDPAVVASPALTTVADIVGLMIYFNSARLVLGL